MQFVTNRLALRHIERLRDDEVDVCAVIAGTWATVANSLPLNNVDSPRLRGPYSNLTERPGGVKSAR